VSSSPTLGQRIRELRTEANMTLAACATESSISVSYLSDIEHDRTVPSLDRLNDVAGVFGLDASELLRGVKTYGEARPLSP